MKITDLFGKVFLSMALIATVAVISSCGDGSVDGASTSSSGGSSGANITDLSGISRTPDTSWHDSYITGAHASYQCGDCHTNTARMNALATSNDQICYQCHVNDYNNTSLLNHSQYKIGTYCNSCHYSDSFTSHSRVSHSEYHGAITSSCESCHTNRYPSSHTGSRTSGCENCHSYSGGGWAVSSSSGGSHYTSNCSSCHLSRMPANHYGTTCENCHSYPSWSGSAAFDHSSITSGCASCHSKHYAGYSCEWCHTFGQSWSFSHSRVNSQACSACHGSDGHGDDDDGHGDWDDDDGHDDD